MSVKSARKRDASVGMDISYLDINQLELAYINRALDSPRKTNVPHFVEIGKNKRILNIQRRNLISVCRGMGKERSKGKLEGELSKVLSGQKRLSLKCFLFK